jgi:hypothetical protein
MKAIKFLSIPLFLIGLTLGAKLYAYSMPAYGFGYGQGGVGLNSQFYCQGLDMPCECQPGSTGLQICPGGGFYGIPGLGGMFLPDRGAYNMNPWTLNLYGQNGFMNPYDSFIPWASYYMPRGKYRKSGSAKSSSRSSSRSKRRRDRPSSGGSSDPKTRAPRTTILGGGGTDGVLDPLPLPLPKEGKDGKPVASEGCVIKETEIGTYVEICKVEKLPPIVDRKVGPLTEGEVTKTCADGHCDEDPLARVKDIFASLKIGDSCQPPARVEDSKFYSSGLALEIDPTKEFKTLALAACIYSANKSVRIPSNQFMRCDPNSKKLIMDKPICPSEKYITTMARSVMLAAKCTGVSPDKLFTAMNHESGFNINVSAPDGENSTGLGQTFFSKSGGIADVMGPKKKSDVAKYFNDSSECAVVKAYYKNMETTYENDINSGDKDTFKQSKCEFVSPESGAIKSAITTSLYMRLLSDRYFEINVANRIKDKKCNFEAFKDKKLRDKVKNALFYLNYNKGPETVTVMLCDYMKFMKTQKLGVTAESFSFDGVKGKSSRRNFFGFLKAINESAKQGKVAQELEGFNSAMKEKVAGKWAKRDNGDSIPLVYTEEIVNDLAETQRNFEKINEDTGGMKCGSL